MTDGALRVGLVVPVLNNFDQAIDLIYSAKTRHDLRIYIQPQYLFQVPLAAAWNNGIRQALDGSCDYIIVSNDDVIFAPQTIDDLVDRFTKHVDRSTVMMYPVDVKDDLTDDYDILFVEGQEFTTQAIEDQSYSCFIIKSDFFDRCGAFDENFDPAWWEDTDMKYRIHLLGLNAVQTQIPYVHRRHQTTKKLTQPVNSIKSGNYYIQKWGSANKNLNELYKTPYNSPDLSPIEWRQL